MSLEALSLAVPGVRGLSPYQSGKPIEELTREYGIHDIIKLASNENPLGASRRVIDIVSQELDHIARYPDGNGFALKQALAEKHGVAPEQLTLGNGSNDVLEMVARAFVSPGDEVIFSQHAFAIYPILTQAVSGQAIVVPAKRWGHDLDAMRQRISPKTRVIFIANPNNPTGTWLSETVLENFISLVPEKVIIVIDEAYFEYAQQKDYANAIPWLKKYSNLVVTRTFSKAYGLAGLRVGYAVSSPDIADILNRVRQPFNVNSLALKAAETALKDDSHISHSIELNQLGMAQLEKVFDSLGYDYIPSVGNFICVDVGKPSAQAYEALLKNGIIVRPIANYEMPNHLRITVGRPEENARFIEAFKQVAS